MKPRRMNGNDESGRRRAVIDAGCAMNAHGTNQGRLAGDGHADV